MIFTSIVATAVLADITSEQCSTQSTSIVCRDTSLGSYCYVVDGVCTESCTTATLTSYDINKCRAAGGPNCVANSAADACVLATTCSDVAVPDNAVEGDLCAPSVDDNCEVVTNTNGLECGHAPSRDFYACEELDECSSPGSYTYSTGNLYCAYSADTAPQCVPGCELQTGADDAACQKFGDNCVSDGNSGCKFVDSCAAVSLPKYAEDGDTCAPDIVNDKGCVVVDDGTNLVCTEMEMELIGSCGIQECEDTSFDVYCKGFVDDTTGVLSCTEGCEYIVVDPSFEFSSNETRCRETGGPNCLYRQGDRCSFAETCADITPPANATAGDACAPNMTLRVDCFVDANGACSDTSTPTTSPSTGSGTGSSSEATTVPLDTVDGVSSVASMVTLVVASMMLF